MAGYHNFSMSNNAIDAYRNGEMPLSKWTKGIILEKLEIRDYNVEMFKKLTVAQLKKYFLRYSSWHHTSSRYNCTDFYSMDWDTVEEFAKGDLIIEKETKEKKVETTVKSMIEIEYPVWGGTRNHPRITGYETMEGERNGDWCVGSWKRKKISGNGVTILREWTE